VSFRELKPSLGHTAEQINRAACADGWGAVSETEIQTVRDLHMETAQIILARLETLPPELLARWAKAKADFWLRIVYQRRLSALQGSYFYLAAARQVGLLEKVTDVIADPGGYAAVEREIDEYLKTGVLPEGMTK